MNFQIFNFFRIFDFSLFYLCIIMKQDEVNSNLDSNFKA